MATNTLHTWGPANVDSLLTTAREAVLASGEFLHDNVFTKITLFDWLTRKAKASKKGGASILVPIMYEKNGTAKAYSRDDTMDTSGQEGLTMAQLGPLTVYA